MAGMASTQTLSITAPAQHEWTDHGPSHESANSFLDPYLSNFLFRMGIYGWRKRCLYFLILLLLSLVVINLSLTVWIIKVLDFTMDGMGNLRIRKDGLRLEGQSVFLNSLYASQIQSRQDQSLRFESARNITINTRNIRGKVTSRLVLGDGKLEILSRQFTIRKPNGDILLHVDDDEVIMAANKMRVTVNERNTLLQKINQLLLSSVGQGTNQTDNHIIQASANQSSSRELSDKSENRKQSASGVRFDGSIQTPYVKSEPSQQLKLESPTRTLRIQAPEGIGIESRAGDISTSCLKDLKLQSTEGTISLDSEKVLFKNLKTVLPTSRGQSYSGIFEMCSCENGRLFLSAPGKHCQADDIVCR